MCSRARADSSSSTLGDGGQRLAIFLYVFNAVLNCNMVGTWRGHEDERLRGPAVLCSRDRCQMRDKTAANRDVVIRELQATASYMVDVTQQTKLKRHVRSGRNAKRDWNGAMYVEADLR